MVIKRFLNVIYQLLVHRGRKSTTTWDVQRKPLKPTSLTGYKEVSK